MSYIEQARRNKEAAEKAAAWDQLQRDLEVDTIKKSEEEVSNRVIDKLLQENEMWKVHAAQNVKPVPSQMVAPAPMKWDRLPPLPAPLTKE